MLNFCLHQFLQSQIEYSIMYHKKTEELGDSLYKPPPKVDHSKNFRKLWIVIILSVVFIGGESLGGYISHSISVMSDAFHLLTDLIGFILAYVFILFSVKQPTDKMSFGYHRTQVLGALGNLFIIWALAMYLVHEATLRIMNKVYVEQPTVMLIVAGCGLPVNILMYFVLHSGSHSHGLMSEECKGHGSQSNDSNNDDDEHNHENNHGHNHEHNHGHHNESMSMKAAVLHALTDIIQSIGLLISSLLIFFFGSNYGANVTQFNPWHYLDPISTIIFSIVVILSTWPITKNCYYIIMESTPNKLPMNQLLNDLQSIPGVVSIHNTHAWDLRPGKTILIAHVFSEKGQERNVLRSMTDYCRRKKIYHSTIQVEEEHLMNSDDYILCKHDLY